MLLRYAAAALVLIALAAAASAQDELEGAGGLESFGDPGTSSWTFRLSAYDRADSGDGNPFLDEELTVIEPVILYDHNVSDKFGYSILFSYDKVTSASIDRLSKFDGQSGASADDYFGLSASFRHRTDSTTILGWHIGASDEYDYNSLSFGGSWTKDLAPKDATIGFSLDGYFDQIDVIRFDGTEDSDDDRVSIAATFNWNQILSPTMVGDFGLTLASQSGFLETPYNAVVIEDPSDPPNPNLDNNARGTEITEELPDNRLRTALFGRVRGSIAEHRAWELGGRVYSDDWGITAFSLEPKFIQAFDNGLVWELRYRYYTQSAADDFDDHFTVIENERTQDSDLGDFDAHLFGSSLTWKQNRKSTWDIGLDYVSREDGLDTMFVTLGWHKSF